MKSKIKLRHENRVICPYANIPERVCTNPNCIRMTGQECYLKGNEYYGKTQFEKRNDRDFTQYVGRRTSKFSEERTRQKKFRRRKIR